MRCDVNRFQFLKLFGHVARADKSQDHSCALQACISPAPRNWRRRPGRSRHTLLRTVEEDLHQFNLGLASGLRRAQNRTAWRTLTGTATSPTSSDWWWVHNTRKCNLEVVSSVVHTTQCWYFECKTKRVFRQHTKSTKAEMSTESDSGFKSGLIPIWLRMSVVSLPD